MTGPATVAVYFEGQTEGSADDDNNNGRDEVRTQMTALNLSGFSPLLGPVQMTLSPSIDSMGQMEETANNTPGVLDVPPFAPSGEVDSFFDIYFELTVAGQTFLTVQPMRWSAQLTHKPPGPLDWYEGLEDVPLVNEFGYPTGYFIGATRHRPSPPDLNNDGWIDSADLLILAYYWMDDTCSEPNWCEGADCDFSGMVDYIDFAIFAYDWLALTGELTFLDVGLHMDSLWMYQNLPGADASNLTASVTILDDQYNNSSYTCQWEFILPDDVSMAPSTVTEGGISDISWTFAAPGCNESNGISDSGQTFTVKVIVTGNDHGNIGMAQAQFGVALLGDVNNDKVVNVADRSIINAFWRLGAAGPFTFRDCNINCDMAVNVADRSIANAVWRGVLGQNRVSSPCPLR